MTRATSSCGAAPPTACEPLTSTVEALTSTVYLNVFDQDDLFPFFRFFFWFYGFPNDTDVTSNPSFDI